MRAASPRSAHTLKNCCTSCKTNCTDSIKCPLRMQDQPSSSLDIVEESQCKNLQDAQSNDAADHDHQRLGSLAALVTKHVDVFLSTGALPLGRLNEDVLHRVEIRRD